MKGRALGVIAVLATVAGAGPARSETPPTAWDVAKDPAARATYEMHVTVRELLAMHHKALIETERRGAIEECATTLFIEKARILLETAPAKLLERDVRLRFDLGEVQYLLCNNQAAIGTLKDAVASAPDDPAAPGATLTLAFAFAKLGNHPKDERDAYRAYLAKSVSDPERPAVLLNMAEAEMHLGELDESIATYREAERAGNAFSSGTTAVSSVWGLAVALDRAGDPRGALETARRAEELDPNEYEIRDPEHGGDPGIFFVPLYEREWYLALGATARTHVPGTEARDVAGAWARAAQHWDKYVAGVEMDLLKKGDAPGRELLERWHALAKSHLERAKAERAAAEKRIPRTKKPAEPAAPAHGEFKF
jgi:tetratricopeptide (TPR) repeat protein